MWIIWKCTASSDLSNNFKKVGYHNCICRIYIWIFWHLWKPCLKHIVWEKIFPEKHIIATIIYLYMERTFEIGLWSLRWKWGLVALDTPILCYKSQEHLWWSFFLMKLQVKRHFEAIGLLVSAFQNAREEI